MKFFAEVQDYTDALIQRFCSPKRRIHVRTPWFEERCDWEAVEAVCRERILFYEARGYSLFQEPWIDHQPVAGQFRVVLTFKPTESNQ